MLRSRHPELFCKTGVLRNFAKLTEKHLCQGLFFNLIKLNTFGQLLLHALKLCLKDCVFVIL